MLEFDWLTNILKCAIILKEIKSNQIKSLLLSHHHSTSALVSEILTSVLQTVQKKQQQQQFTYGQYVFTDCTEDNVQNTHTYTIKTYLVIDPHYTLYVHIYIMYTSIHSIMWRCNRLYIYSRLVVQQIVVQRCNRLCICNVVDVHCMVSKCMA